MKYDIVYYHKELQKHIHTVERDETNRNALDEVKETFLTLFNLIKMIMISHQERYYGIFLMNLDLKIDFTSHYDAGVSIDSFPFCMTVNPLLIGLKSLSEMIYIFCHEIEHIVLNHPADCIRYNPQKDMATALKLNIAMDASINDKLTADSRTNGFSVISEPTGAITSSFLCENFDMHVKPLQAFDYYFERIPDSKNSGNTPIKICLPHSDNRNEIITEPKRKGTIYIPCRTTIDDPDEVTSIIKRFVSDVCKGMSESMRGRLPDYQKKVLNKLMSQPVISWKQLLKRYIGTIPDGHRKTRLRLSRRQPERYDISGHINDRIIKLVVAIDTSGSMSTEDLERIMVEIFDIIGTRKCETTVIECDAEIKRIYKIRSVKDVSYDINGGGGTSFIPVIKYINSNRYFRDAILIYFTDGMGNTSIPRPLTRRTMWILHNEHCKLSVRNPHGEVLVMDK